MTRYFHLYADGKTVKEISQVEYFAIRKASLSYKSPKRMTARVHTYKDKLELSIAKGQNYVYLTMLQIDELRKRMYPTCYEIGCPFADSKTGTCDDKACIAHPTNFWEK